jgi:hypothetical protein
VLLKADPKEMKLNFYDPLENNKIDIKKCRDAKKEIVKAINLLDPNMELSFESFKPELVTKFQPDFYSKNSGIIVLRMASYFLNRPDKSQYMFPDIGNNQEFWT